MIQELRLHNPTALDLILLSFGFVQSFFSWWYGDVPLSVLAFLKRAVIVLDDRSSFTLILKGFFRPWKNDYNIAGWLIGLVIKAVYLPLVGSLLLISMISILGVLLLQLMLLPVIIGLIALNPFLTP